MPTSSRRELVLAGLAVLVETGCGGGGSLGPEWHRVGSVDEIGLVPELWERHVVRGEAVFLWVADPRRREGSREVRALSARCTHLGCPVRYGFEARRFICPCHAAVFDERGAPVSGPAPRPLDTFAVRVRGGQIYLGRRRRRRSGGEFG
jgi:Rieske Fe-S protein